MQSKRPKVAIKQKDKYYLLRRILGLIFQKANKQEYYLEIGTYFLKKGTGYSVGQIVAERRLRDNIFKVKVITGIFYDFGTNKINHTAENRLIKSNEKGR